MWLSYCTASIPTKGWPLPTSHTQSFPHPCTPVHPYTHRHTGRAFCLALGKLRTAHFALGQQISSHLAPQSETASAPRPPSTCFSRVSTAAFSLTAIWSDSHSELCDMTHTLELTHVIFNTGNRPVSSGPHVGCSSELPCVGCGDGTTLLVVTTQIWPHKWLLL